MSHERSQISGSTAISRYIPQILPAEIHSGRAMVKTSRELCGFVRQLTAEMMMMAGERALARRDRRRALCHARQVSMYVCHVTLGMSLAQIGEAFGRDRSTVGHSCHVVEDRRDDPGFDEFVAAIERVASMVWSLPEAVARDR